MQNSLPPRSYFRRMALLPWVVLVLTVALTMASWWLVSREVKRTAQARFDRLIERAQNSVRRRFDTAALLLQGAAAFPTASDDVTARDWSDYLRRVSGQMADGVVGLGYAERVARDQVARLEARMHAEGEPAFQAERVGDNPWLYVVIGIEPREHNTDVLGIDIGSGTTRKEAAEAAAGLNGLVLSRRIHLNYDHALVPGFLLFLPVYRKGADLGTPARRLDAVAGWVYASIRIDQLMSDVAESVGQIDLDLFEGDTPRMGNLLYDADGQLRGQPERAVTAKDYSRRAFSTIVPFDIYGRRWTLWLSTRTEFDRATFSFLPAAVLLLGLFFSALVTLLTWVLVNSRRQALTLAGAMTADLRRMALLASRTSSGVILTDPEWRVEWINNGFTRIFGFTLDEIKGRQPASFLIGAESDPKTMQAIDTAAKLRQPFSGEILNYTKDGRKVWIELEIQPVLNEQDELEGFMGLQLDINERKRHAEQMRVAVENAEKANVAKSEFLAMMSHEIRTPMNGVIGMTSLLLDTPLTPEQRESAEIIRQSGESLVTIINDILDFSKAESGRLEIEHTEFALADCVEGALDLLAVPAAKKNLELLYEISDTSPAMVVGDAARLRQVLVNLVGNAVKFTASGEVLVTVGAGLLPGGRVELMFEIRDTGIGISPEGMERLFKPFSQVDASTTRKFGGTGLGLAISRRLVDLMGGKISVESESGQGSTFRFTLRLEVIAEGALLPASTQSLGGRHVLIVEDNATSRRILTGLIAKWGMHPVAAESSARALELLRQDEKFDAALIDLHLRGLDGQALAASIRALPARAALPLILLTAQRPGEKPAGSFNAVLVKPIKPSQLFDAFVRIFWPSRVESRPPV